MPEATPVEIPFVNLNDEIVKLISWLVADGDEVREGQFIAEVETSKALVELLSPATGQIHLVMAAGQDLPVGAVVAYVGDNQSNGQLPSQEVQTAGGAVNRIEESHNASGTRFSRKAMELIQSRRIPVTEFAGSSLVREQDVLNYLGSAISGKTAAVHLHIALKDISVEGLTFPAIFQNNSTGRIDQQFLSLLLTDSERISDLDSAEKCELYRAHGADIGEDVSIGKGTIVVAPQIQIGNRVAIGANSSIVLRERFAVAELSSFREDLSIQGGTAIFGENTFAGNRIQIGGGGHSDPWALLVAGDNVYLGDDLFINICRPVLIGKEVFLTQRAILVTHNIGHSILEGNENTFAPIVLEDYSQVGMNSTIYAGARVGKSAILGTNSYLISAIPNGKLAMGVPARVIRDAARPIDRRKQLQITNSLFRQFRELLSLKGVEVSCVHSTPILNFEVSHLDKKYRIGFSEFLAAADGFDWDGNENVLWTFESTETNCQNEITIMNLLGKTIKGPSGFFADSAREFLRKRGIRLEPGPWRYQKGLI